LLLLAFCVFADAPLCGLPGSVGAEAFAFPFGCGGLFWLCELCAGVVSLVVAVPDVELFLAWDGRLPAGAGGGLAGAGLSCGALAASSKAENGWEVVSCCVAAAAARC
jgi:hypothetical protein